MDFIDEIKQFSKRVDSLKDNLPTEEATKTSLIMPFFLYLDMMYLIPKSLCLNLLLMSE